MFVGKVPQPFCVPAEGTYCGSGPAGRAADRTGVAAHREKGTVHMGDSRLFVGMTVALCTRAV